MRVESLSIKVKPLQGFTTPLCRLYMAVRSPQNAVRRAQSIVRPPAPLTSRHPGREDTMIGRNHQIDAHPFEPDHVPPILLPNESQCGLILESAIDRPRCEQLVAVNLGPGFPPNL